MGKALPSHWKQTYTGIAFDVFAPTFAMISIEDIAHALACTNRYGGHAPAPYNVAQHSVLVADVVRARAPAFELWALLHDAAEAYVGDMIRPLKRHPEMLAFREAERIVMGAICAKFDLGPLEPGPVIEADMDMLATEAAVFFPVEQRPGNWNLPGRALEISVKPWGWKESKTRFLARFAALWPRSTP